MSVKGESPDSTVVHIMAKGMHDSACHCGAYPCRVPFKFDPTSLAQAALSALLSAGYEWVRSLDHRGEFQNTTDVPIGRAAELLKDEK